MLAQYTISTALTNMSEGFPPPGNNRQLSQPTNRISDLTTPLKLAEGMAEVLLEEARLAKLNQQEAEKFWSENSADMHSVTEFMYPGAGGQQQRLRLYRASAETRPTLLYIHGGGWIGGSIELNDSATRALAAQSGRHVVSISYRFAPQYPYPAALSDCLAAVQWLQSDKAPGDLTRHLELQQLAIGGPSAGANLSLATALSLPAKTFDALVLFYGVYNDDMSVKSYTQHRDGPGFLTQSRMEHIFEAYDPEQRRRTDTRVTPLNAELEGLPHTIVAAAEIDVLRTESEQLAERLHKAGVEVTAWIEAGVTHGFINRGRLLPAAQKTLLRAAEALAKTGK